jgi:hypothetical protein
LPDTGIPGPSEEERLLGAFTSVLTIPQEPEDAFNATFEDQSSPITIREPALRALARSALEHQHFCM